MDFRGKLILAPLAGITDTSFRLLCRENGADVVLTEMASAKGLLMQPARTRQFLEYCEDERPVGAQLFGASPAEMGGEGAGGGGGGGPRAPRGRAGGLAAAAVRGGEDIPVTENIRSGFGKESET